MKTLRIAIAQINTVVGDLKGNADNIIKNIHRADALSASIIVFPELAVSGYPPEDLLLKKTFIAANLRELKRIAKNTGNIHAIVGYADKGKPAYNSAAILHHGKIQGKYHKIFLPNYGVFDEKRYFSPGTVCPVFRIEGVRIGVNICEDIWMAQGPSFWQARKGKAKILINLSSSPFHMGKFAVREKLMKKRAKESGAFVIYCNLVGGQDELVFDGGSMAVAPNGRIVAMGKQFEEDLLIIDLPNGDYTKGKKDSALSGEKETFFWEPSKVPLVSLPYIKSDGQRPPLPKRKVNRMSEIEEIYSALVIGVRDYARKNGFQRALLGLSGGIDSALTAAIAVDALGDKNIMGVTMPSKYSSKGSVNDSEKLAGNFGISLKKIPIGRIVNAFERELKPLFSGRKSDVAEENIQSRVRGNLLMAISNKFGWLLLATGNKSEISTGYCTLYGDMAGGFAVIKDVPKTLVYRLSVFRNKKAGYDIIPEKIIEKEPSAELRPNQKDIDSLPPYPLLDEILFEYIERDRGQSEIIRKKGNATLTRRVIELVDRSEYKRRQGPPGVKITPKAFGRDRRYPLVNRFRD